MIRFNIGINSLDFSVEINENLIIYFKELIIQIPKTTIILSDDIVESPGLVIALYLKSAYLEEETYKSFYFL